MIYDPVRETEFLVKENISTTEKDGTLRYLCSTYDSQSDRLQLGMANAGPRVLTFASLLQIKEIPLNKSIQTILRLCDQELGNPVEIEFAMTFSPPSLGLLQVRPMVVSSEHIQVSDADLVNEKTLAASEKALGNGLIEDILDIVNVIPDQFELENTQSIACELEIVNRSSVNNGTPYLMIVFGRLAVQIPGWEFPSIRANIWQSGYHRDVPGQFQRGPEPGIPFLSQLNQPWGKLPLHPKVRKISYQLGLVNRAARNPANTICPACEVEGTINYQN